jgi:hypothetical protein
LPDGRKVLEHRHVVEQRIGRPLLAGEHIHHRNGDKADNRDENLAVLTNREHRLLHVRQAGRQS